MIDPVIRTGGGHAARATNAQARQTALVVAAVFALIALWNLYRARPLVVAVFGGAALVLIVAGLFVPAAARVFYVFWMRVAVVLGHVNSRVLLTVLYYGLFTPYGLVSRLLRDPLRRRGARGESYWVERKTSRQTREQFERLF